MGEVHVIRRRLLLENVPWLLASGEPSACWLTLTALLGRSLDDPTVVAAHADVMADPRTSELIRRLGDWEEPARLGGHNSPAFAPNLLCLLAQMGVGAGDDARIERILDRMLWHRDAEARFASSSVSRASPNGEWGALLCDTHAITEALIRFGRADEPEVGAALARMEGDLLSFPAGPAWPCIPSLGFRGPGRKGEPCPQVTVEALRTFALLPGDRRPQTATDAARTLLAIWRTRATSKPYMFGHGVAFKTVKWPPTWYSVLTVLDALAGYPELWRGDETRPEDRASLAELVACLVAYNVDADGRVTPQSCYRGFEAFSFGQKETPSAFATALVASVVQRLDDLADEIDAIDVRSLPSSKGGAGTARPPKRAAVEP